MSISQLFKKSVECKENEKFHGSENTYLKEVRRLNLLENAVVNYSGGIFQLITRLNNEMDFRENTLHSTEAEKVNTQLLKDLQNYLRDVSGHLKM